MEPVRPIYRNPARRVEGWALTGADGRPPRVVKSLHLQPRGPRAAQPRARRQVPGDRGRRGPLGRRGPRRRGAGDRRLRDRGPGRPDGGRACPCRRSADRPLPPDQPLAVPVRRARRARARRARAILVVELSAGQMVEDVRLAVEGRAPVLFHGRTGGMVPTPDEVVGALRSAWALTPARDGGEPMTAMTAPHRRGTPAADRRGPPGTPRGPRHALLPGLRPRGHPPARRRGPRRARAGSADDRGGGRRLRRLRLRLPARRLRRGPTRPGAGRRDGDPPRPAGRVRPDLPGRRRPGRHRDRGDHPRRRPRRADHGRLRQQRDLRDDRRPDGPDHPARPEDDLDAARPRRPDGRLPDPDHRDARDPAGQSTTPRAARWPRPAAIGKTKAMLRRACEIQAAGGSRSASSRSCRTVRSAGT